MCWLDPFNWTFNWLNELNFLLFCRRNSRKAPTVTRHWCVRTLTRFVRFNWIVWRIDSALCWTKIPAADCYNNVILYILSNFPCFLEMLNVSAVILANLCVCYIMTSSNEEAEEVMKRVEKEESRLEDSSTGSESSEKKSFHLSIINLVIGTLYCSKVEKSFVWSIYQLPFLGVWIGVGWNWILNFPEKGKWRE